MSMIYQAPQPQSKTTVVPETQSNAPDWPTEVSGGRFLCQESGLGHARIPRRRNTVIARATMPLRLRMRAIVTTTASGDGLQRAQAEARLGSERVPRLSWGGRSRIPCLDLMEARSLTGCV